LTGPGATGSVPISAATASLSQNGSVFLKPSLLSFLVLLILAAACSDPGGTAVTNNHTDVIEQPDVTDHDADVAQPDVVEDAGADVTDVVDGGYDVVEERPWYEGEDATSLEPFTFAVVSDTHLRLPGWPDDEDYDNQENLDNLNALVEVINNGVAEAKFVAVTGDLVGALFSDDPDDYGIGGENPAETFKAVMDNLIMPYEVVLGNHDYQAGYDGEGLTSISPLLIEAVWEKVLGIQAYSSFVYRGHRFVFLNSVRGPAYWDVCIARQEELSCTGSFDEMQLWWLEQELLRPEPVFLFFHNPVYSDSWYTVWSAVGNSFKVVPDDAFYTLAETYADKIRAIFVGHGHLWAEDTLSGTIRVYETSSIGDGMGSPENINVVSVDPAAGTFTVTRY